MIIGVSTEKGQPRIDHVVGQDAFGIEGSDRVIAFFPPEFDHTIQSELFRLMQIASTQHELYAGTGITGGRRSLSQTQAAAFLRARAPAKAKKQIRSIRMEDGSGALTDKLAVAGLPLKSVFPTSNPLYVPS